MNKLVLTHREKLIYLAALIDSGSSVWIQEHRVDGITKTHTGSIGIILYNKAQLEWLNYNFGGSICRIKRPHKYETAKPRESTHYFMNRWRTSSKNILDIALAVRPFLVAKREHIEILIDFRSTFGNKKDWRNRKEEKIKYRKNCMDRLGKINKFQRKINEF